MNKLPKILLIAAVLLALTTATALANGPDKDGSGWTEMKEYHEQIHGDSFETHHQSMHGEDWEEHVAGCHATAEDGDKTTYERMGGMMGAAMM